MIDFTAIPRRILFAIGGVIGVVLVGWLILHLWQSSSQAAGKARLSRETGKAASESGHDAVESLGASQAKEEAIDQITGENDHAIRSAPGADAPVNPAVRDAGLAGLCRRAAYRGDPRCLQFTPAQPVEGRGGGRPAAGGG